MIGKELRDWHSEQDAWWFQTHWLILSTPRCSTHALLSISYSGTNQRRQTKQSSKTNGITFISSHLNRVRSEVKKAGAFPLVGEKCLGAYSVDQNSVLNILRTFTILGAMGMPI